MNRYFYRRILTIATLLAFVSLDLLPSSAVKKATLPDPQIKMEIAKLSGKIIHMDPDTLNEKPVITLMFPNPVTAEIKEFKTELRKDGTFNFEVPIVCNILIGSISSNIFESPILIGLEIGKETKIEFVHTEIGPIKARMKSGIGLTVDNPSRFNEVMQMMHNPIPERYKLKLYKLTPAEYAQECWKLPMKD
ncbi:hypothetical protein [Parabacteroides sp. Marseille-P3160]|uniref:hypothetical protein n=1 Tax=Parabacteroides sp. Marseille-P3160 TaxID=1917887 RepID=UPI0009B9EC39|nr:hypothetical protein [Parabacteroides sp. Marseille-P3160]